MALRWAIYFIVTSNEVTLLEVQSGMPLSSFFSYFCLALLPCKWCCVGQCYFIVTSNEVTLLKVRSGIPLSSYFHISAWRCYHVNAVALGNVILSPLRMKLLIYKQSASFSCCSSFFFYSAWQWYHTRWCFIRSYKLRTRTAEVSRFHIFISLESGTLQRVRIKEITWLLTIGRLLVIQMSLLLFVVIVGCCYVRKRVIKWRLVICSLLLKRI